MDKKRIFQLPAMIATGWEIELRNGVEGYMSGRNHRRKCLKAFILL
jgi:hypothetical protein